MRTTTLVFISGYLPVWLMERSSDPRRHRDATLRTMLGAQTATIAIFGDHRQFAVDHFPGSKITDAFAIAAKIALIHIGRFDQVALIAFVFGGIGKIAAAIVATKADTVGDPFIHVIAERPCHQVLFGGFLEESHYFREGDLFQPTAAGPDIVAVHETDIHAGTSALPFLLPTAAVRYPKSIMGKSHLPGLFMGADIVNS